MIYHKSTWPLALSPAPLELLDYLAADYGLAATASDAELSAILQKAGHKADEARAYFQCVLSIHSAQRYRARTGKDF